MPWSQNPEELAEILKLEGAAVSERRQMRPAAAYTDVYSDIFSQGEGDTGKTGLLKYNIQTGDAKPGRRGRKKCPKPFKVEGGGGGAKAANA